MLTIDTQPHPTPIDAKGRGRPRVRVTELDLARLRETVDQHSGGAEGDAAELLAEELDRAEVLPQSLMPRDVVTMRSRVVFQDISTGITQEAVLVYPREADMGQSKLSVLAPVGTALLGLSCGERISWPMPRGRTRTIQVLNIPYQPEAAGDFDL